MSKTNQNPKNTYRNATGTISVTLRNDMMLHYTMQKSEFNDARSDLEKLRQLCLANGIDPNVM
ncbi:MAG: hypothetical protein J6N53_15870 [Lachnospiraceae bacterium]|nr:hypothetical protein [Lachnospiraceae bacterium]MBO6300307.1 hypothetical protein [Lachnospiraceae bacterium]